MTKRLIYPTEAKKTLNTERAFEKYMIMRKIIFWLAILCSWPCELHKRDFLIANSLGKRENDKIIV